MELEAITEESVRDALRSVRYARPLADSTLLEMDALRVRVRADGPADTGETRERLLGRMLDEVIWEQLCRLRGVDPASSRADLTPERELALLTRDFESGRIEREAWAVLHFRYMSEGQPPLSTLTEECRVPERTVSRRLGRGHRALVEVLRNIERDAATAVTRGHNAPEPLTRFIGRDQELADSRRLLAAHRLVTLTGPGGIGKSRLAIHLARDLAADFSDGVWFVEMAALEEGRQVPQAVVGALGLREQPGRSLTDTLIEHLVDRAPLLVLDNCEHVVVACSDLVGALLGQCPSLQVLATSQEELHVDGQAVFSVPPMAWPAEPGAVPVAGALHFDAVRLFGGRAAAAQPGFRVDADNAVQVTRICTQLEGIPLAIELAAARARFLTLDQLEARLADRFQLLKDGRHASRPGHETLLATMDWSYQLLDGQEQALLRRLSVFRGGWALEAAESVCQGIGIAEGNVLELLTQLHAKSLVRTTRGAAEGHYEMLETTRQFARACLEEEGRETHWRDRHTAYFLTLAERAGPELSGPDRDTWQPRLAGDYANVRRALLRACERQQVNEALSAAAAMCEWWEQQGQLDEGRILLERLLASDASTEQTVERAAVLRAVSELARRQGEHADARQAAEEAIEASRCIDDTLGVAHACTKLATLESAEGDRDTARRLYEESLAVYHSLGREIDAAEAHTNLGILAARQGDYDLARQYLQPGLEVLREIGNEHDATPALMALGVVAQYQSDFTTAREMFEETLMISRNLDDKYVMAAALHNLGVTADAAGDWTEARRRFEESLALTREMGDKPGTVETLGMLGTLAIHQGDLDEGRVLLSESLALAREIGLANSISHILTNLGHVATRQNYDEIARQWLEEGLAVAASIGDKKGLAILHSNLGALAARRGDQRAAHDHMSECLALNKELGDPTAFAESLRQSARIAAIQEKPERALRLIGAAEKLREHIGHTLSPAGVEELEAEVDQASTILGDDGAARERAVGRGLTMDEAVAYALGEVTWDDLADEVAARMEAGDEGEVVEEDDASPE